MVARTAEPLARAAEEAGGHAIAADVSTPEGVHTLATYVGELLGDAPDLIVSAAGAFSLARLDQAAPEDFDRQIAANLRGPFLLVRAFLPAMLRRRTGHFVHIGSVAGRAAFPENGALRGQQVRPARAARGAAGRRCAAPACAPRWWSPRPPTRRCGTPSIPTRGRTCRRARPCCGRKTWRARCCSRRSSPPAVQISSIAVEAAG